MPCHHIEWRVAQSPCKEPASVFGQNRKVTLAILVPSYGGKEVSREREAVNPDRTVIGQGEVPVVNLEDVSYRSNRSVSESDRQTYGHTGGRRGRWAAPRAGPGSFSATCSTMPRWTTQISVGATSRIPNSVVTISEFSCRHSESVAQRTAESAWMEPVAR